jgi:hypothetical protein
LFFLLGLFWGYEIRTTFLADPAQRLAYYAFISGLGLLAFFWPKTGPFVALGESSLNLLLLCLGILVPIYGLADQALEGGALALPYSAGEVLLNGLLSGTFFIVGFRRAQAEILRRYIPSAYGWKREGRRDVPPA